MDKDTSTNSGNTPINPRTSPVPNSEKLSDGQHVDHWILSDEDRAKGFIRPVRRSYIHEKCGGKTSMPLKIAETYAAKPDFYGSTFCVNCGDYFPVGAEGEFLWDGTNEKVGT
jgi:hypothetical protein